MHRTPPGVAQAERLVGKVKGGLHYRPPTEARVTKETLPLRTARLLGIAAETSGKVGQAGKAELIRLLSHPLHRDRLRGSELREALLHQRILEASRLFNNKRETDSLNTKATSTRLPTVAQRSKKSYFNFGLRPHTVHSLRVVRRKEIAKRRGDNLHRRELLISSPIGRARDNSEAHLLLPTGVIPHANQVQQAA